MYKILVIDDDVMSRTMLKKRLERYGYAVELAMDGIEGTRLCLLDPPDLVLTDIFMPEKEGIETIRDIKRRCPEVIIFAMSGGPTTFTANYLPAAKMFGASRSFAKPLKWENLLAALREVLPDEMVSKD